MSATESPASRLRRLLAEPRLRVSAACHDALSARLIEQAGFELAFMSGFAVSAARIGAPDTGLISYGEMLDQGRNICAATSLPIIGDGDTGYGNALNVKRTVRGYASAGFAAILIEDQVAPKRCGHTKGKLVVERDEAIERVRAACDARDEGADILILARTDAIAVHGPDEAIARARAFAEVGADILFVEAPRTEAEMARICREAPGVHLANLVEGGTTPIPSEQRLAELGFRIALYPLTVLSSATKAMTQALAAMREGRRPDELLLDFGELRRRVGFDDYYEAEHRYTRSARGD